MDIKTFDDKVIIDEAVITGDIIYQIVLLQHDKNEFTVKYRETLSQAITKLILSCDGGCENSNIADIKDLLLNLCYLRDVLEWFMLK